MSYFSPEVVQQVKQIDLLTYLKTYEPYELVRFSGNTYTTRIHDSLKISKGRWMWWSQGIGGRTALDYLIKVRDYTFLEAMELITGQASMRPVVPLPAEKETEKRLLLLEKYHDQTHVVQYLTGKGIDMDVIKERVANGEEQLERLESDMLEKKEMVEAVLPAYRRFKSWAEEFDSADLEQKKMIACQIFDRIELGKGYQLTIHRNVTYKQFCSEWVKECIKEIA